MSFVRCAATAVPAYSMSQAEVIELARTALHGKVPFLDTALDLFRNAGVENRHLICDPRTLLEGRGLKWRNDRYIEACQTLGVQLLDELLDRSGRSPRDIDVLITTSCTGFMIPALDAHLINHFDMRSDVRRMPFTELGCAAGAMGLSRAHDHLRAYPSHRVVVIAIEVPSMTYLHRDMSVANLVSAALFGDGGAAALLDGDPGPIEILDTRSHFFHGTPEMMGFELMDDGFRIVLDKRVSQLLEDRLPPALNDFLHFHDLTPANLKNFFFHPGGRRILDTLETILELESQDLRFSRRTLSEVGNLSSATVLWVLAKALAEVDLPPHRGPSLIGAFGPGFHAEMLLAEWHGW